MKVHLMYPDRRFEPERELPAQAADLSADLGLENLLAAMSGGDPVVRDLARTALFTSLTEVPEIRYRQQVLSDCVDHREVVTRMYQIAGEAMEVPRKVLLGWNSTRPSLRLHHARSCMTGFVTMLRQLRTEADVHGHEFASAGLQALCASLQEDLSEDYLAELEHFLALLEFRSGVPETVRLGLGNEGVEHVLRTPRRSRPGVLDILTSEWSRHTVSVAPRDMAGMGALSDLKEHGLAVTAEALAQSADQVKGFFVELRQELAFYLGCLNLRDALVDAGQPVCLPDPRPVELPGTTATSLHDPLLGLSRVRHSVGSDLDADESLLVVVTGANQGGKSTFLRALGLAQLMMQAGMFVTAEAFSASVAVSVHTHFKREEDDTMTSGKFDEELARMSTIVDAVAPGSLVLCNESFSATNEREAAEVGGGVLEGLVDCGVRVHLVTHLHDFAERLRRDVAASTFGRAQRLPDGSRSFEIKAGEPLATSFAADLYTEVFGEPLGV